MIDSPSIEDALRCQECLHLLHEGRVCDSCLHNRGAGTVYVAEVDTPVDSDAWRLIGRTSDGFSLGYDLGPYDDAEVLRLATGGQTTVHFTLHGPARLALQRQITRLFGVPWRLMRPRTGPPPLAPGCLPRSKQGRRRAW